MTNPFHFRLLNISFFFWLLSGFCTAQDSSVFSSDLSTEKKPWTHLNFANDPEDFQFAIVSDRTGGPRPGIFEDAIMKLNWLQPEFVISVGDLIEGVQGKDSIKLAEQWGRHFDRIKPLKMPFFHLAGNHDIKANNPYQVDYWNKMFGTPFYSFTYKGVLFLGLFSNEGFQTMSDEQVEYFAKVLEEHKEVKWTMVFMHHPLWIYPHFTNFDRLEKLLKDRKHTVFAGHHHRYHQYDRNGSNYYVLATTGGGSGLLGNSFGMFDHITWITMTDDGPSMANLRLDGILPHDVANDETTELSKALIQSVFFESEVMVDDPKKFRHGKAYIHFTNSSDLPIYLDARFFHNHYVQAHPDQLHVEIPPKSSSSVEIELEAIEAFNLDEKIALQLNASLSYQHEEYRDLKMSGTQSINISLSEFDALPIQEADFIGSYSLKMRDALPGTSIHYTLDGKEPDKNSPVYYTPIEVDKSVVVKARLIAEEGYESKVDQMHLNKVRPGKGVLVKYFENDVKRNRWFKVPDFVSLDPLTIKVSQSLELEDAGRRKDFFGAVYKGFIDLPEEGVYTFSIISDDGAVLFVDGKQVVVDVVKHKPREVFGELKLSAGKHALEWHYYQDKKGKVMEVYYELPSGEKKKVDISMLTYGEDTEEAILEIPEGKD